MGVGLRPRAFWGLCLAGIIATGILSRVVTTGFVIFDKYLGDALYAAMVYAALRLFQERRAAVVSASVAMVLIECFQLTLIPARLLGSDLWAVRLTARLMGTQFSFLDLLAYAVGIGCIYLAERRRGDGSPTG
jgi:hypothetical protein